MKVTIELDTDSPEGGRFIAYLFGKEEKEERQAFTELKMPVKTRDAIIEYLKRNPGASHHQILLALGINDQALRNQLWKLQREKLVVRSAVKPFQYYFEEDTDLKEAVKGARVEVLR